MSGSEVLFNSPSEPSLVCLENENSEPFLRIMPNLRPTRQPGFATANRVW